MVKASISAANGSFMIELSEKGDYIIAISYMGYKRYISKPINLSNKGVIDIGYISMVPKHGVLSEVVIKSRKNLIQNKGDRIVYNASADISNKAGSASDVLRKAPMVTVDAQGDIKMRGSSNIKVLINGVPSNIMAKNLKEALKMIPASSIESIEIITTPSAKYEAEGAAGVINIITKRKMKGTTGTIDLSVGNLDQSANTALNITKGKFNFNITLNVNREKLRNVSELNRTSLTNGTPTGKLIQRTDATQINQGDYGDFTADFRPDSSQKFSATISFWKGSWPTKSTMYNSSSQDNPVLTEYNQTSDQWGKFHQLDFTLNYQKKFRRTGQEIQLIGQFSKSGDQSNYLTQQVNLSNQSTFREQSPNIGSGNDIIFQADYTHPLGKSSKNLLEIGTRVSKTSSSSEFKVFNNRNNLGSPILVADTSRSDNMKYFQNILASYLSLRFETKNNWIFRPGLRLENTRLGSDFAKGNQPFEATFSNIVSSILLSKKVNDKHDVKFSYVERIRRPWIWDLNPYLNASDPKNTSSGNPQLRPELIRMIEVAHSYNKSTNLTLNSSIYVNANNNAIEYLSTVDNQGNSHTTPQNVASTKRIGANSFADIQINSKWILGIGAEFYHVWFRSPALSVKNDASFYSLTLNSSYTLPSNFTIQISGDYSNGYVTLQGRNSANYNYRFSLRKDILKKKASLTVIVTNPFQQTFLQQNFTTAPSFQSEMTNRFYNRSFVLSFSWSFGSMRDTGDSNKKNQDKEERQMPDGRKR